MEGYGVCKQCIILPCCSILCYSREQELLEKFYRENGTFNKPPSDLTGNDLKEWKKILSRLHATRRMEYETKKGERIEWQYQKYA